MSNVLQLKLPQGHLTGVMTLTTYVKVKVIGGGSPDLHFYLRFFDGKTWKLWEPFVSTERHLGDRRICIGNSDDRLATALFERFAPLTQSALAFSGWRSSEFEPAAASSRNDDVLYNDMTALPFGCTYSIIVIIWCISLGETTLWIT